MRTFAAALLCSMHALQVPAQSLPHLEVQMDLRLDASKLDVVPASRVVADASGRMYVTQGKDATVRVFGADGVEGARMDQR